MEKILRSEEMAEIILLPIRHHSPACAFHVRRMIEDVHPCVILVEGPENANPLIPVMVNEDTEAPFAIYYSYHDESGRISGEKERYKCYYPFLDYSPELAALREGEKLGIRTAFIDLPYGDILAASREGRGLLNRETEKNNYNDDHLLSQNEYLKQLCERTGLRSFDEFWEKYFEMNGLRQEDELWFSNLLTYCALARENTRQETLEEEGCLARERYMAERIREYAKEAGSGQNTILVVTGGFHTLALKALLAGDSGQRDARLSEGNAGQKNVTLLAEKMEQKSKIPSEKDTKTDNKSPLAKNAEMENEGLSAKNAEMENEGLLAKNAEMENEGLSAKNVETGNEGLSAKNAEMENEGLSAKNAEMENEGLSAEGAESGNEGLMAKGAGTGNEGLSAEGAETENEGLSAEGAGTENECLAAGKTEKERALQLTETAGKKRDIGKVPEKDQGVYLMPYSMEAADALNGYASGMPFPGFYQKIWEALEERDTDTPYSGVVLDMIVSSGKETRRKEGYLSTYDEICACSMAEGLAGLRGKQEPGAYELMDAVLSSFVKGEYNLASDTPMRILRKRMTGKKAGKLCPQADVPPIIHDFEAQCRKFKLKTGTTLESESTLSIFSNPKHRQASMFFHRVTFLGTAFARKVKGPNLQLKRDKNLMREIWKYKWNAQVNSALIDVSVYGGTMEEAAAGIVKERLVKEMGAKEGAVLLTHVFEMGLKEQLQPVYTRVHELMLQDTDFYSLAEALRSLLMMEELGELYGSPMEFGTLIRIGCRKLISLLPSMTRIKDEDLTACMNALKLLYQITGRDRGGSGSAGNADQNRKQNTLSAQHGEEQDGQKQHEQETYGQKLRKHGLYGQEQQERRQESYGQEREAYFDALVKMIRDSQIHAGLNGCIHGMLYGSGRETAAEVEMVCRGYLTGTGEQLLGTAQFFKGLFYAARDLVFIGDAFLKMLDTFFGQVTAEEFMELLPELRMAFTYFTPRETDRIAGMAAELHGKKRGDILEREEILPEWYSYGAEIDAYVKGKMGKR